MNKYKIFLSILLVALAVAGCTEKTLEPITKSLGKPDMVTVNSTEALPGGILIRFTIPNTEDILSVKAVYTLSNGKTMQQDVSYFENKIEILGYNDTNEHTIALYTVNRAQEMSDAKEVKFRPLESPLVSIKNSVEILACFGGAEYRWENEFLYPINLEFYTVDSLGEMQLQEIITSEIPSSNRKLRGYDSIPRTFGLVIRDNYENQLDTIKQTVTPFFEERFDKKLMSIMRLNNDASFQNWEGTDYYIIDDDKSTFGHSPANSLPATFTIDMGVVGKISRIVFFNRLYSNSYYSWGNPKDIKVYGRREAPSQSGDWSEWGEPIIVDLLRKPSGLPSGTDTDEDVAFATAGFNFDFPIDVEPLRYIRVSILSTQTGPTYTHPAEVDIYGQLQK
jgi:hypothetical protein